jgi:hypothetical protein
VIDTVTTAILTEAQASEAEAYRRDMKSAKIDFEEAPATPKLHQQVWLEALSLGSRCREARLVWHSPFKVLG